jgi:hypothetical protein
MLRIKSKLKVITKEGYTYRKLLGELKSGKVVSIPELLQRILPKDVWDNAVKNSYMDENFIFTGASELQAFRFIKKQALVDSLQNDIFKTLNDDHAEFIEKSLEIINRYPDAEEFIIDGQSRGLLALVPFFDGEHKYINSIEFENGQIITGFFFTEHECQKNLKDPVILNDVQRDCLLDQLIDGKTVIKGNLKDAAALVIGMNTNNPFSQSGKNWLIWFDELKFKVSDEIISHFNLPALFSKKHISEDSTKKYNFAIAGHVQFMFESIHMIKNINTPANYSLPSAGKVNTMLNNTNIYIKKLQPDDNEYALLKICMGSLADIQMTDIMIPKYANAMNLMIKYQFMFNPDFERGQTLLEEIFPGSWVKYRSQVKINDRKEFARYMITEEINSMHINEHELDSEGNVKKDKYNKTITDREGIKYIMQAANDTQKMAKRFELIEGFLKPILSKLKDLGIIEIVQKRKNSDSWYAVYNKTKGTQEDVYGRPIVDSQYLENKADYDIGHIEPTRKGGEDTIDNKELEDAGKNRSKGARNY